MISNVSKRRSKRSRPSSPVRPRGKGIPKGPDGNIIAVADDKWEEMFAAKLNEYLRLNLTLAERSMKSGLQYQTCELWPLYDAARLINIEVTHRYLAWKSKAAAVKAVAQLSNSDRREVERLADFGAVTKEEVRLFVATGMGWESVAEKVEGRFDKSDHDDFGALEF